MEKIRDAREGYAGKKKHKNNDIFSDINGAENGESK